MRLAATTIQHFANALEMGANRIIQQVISALLIGLLWNAGVRADDAESLRVMTFNIWVGGEYSGQPPAQTAKVIQSARADVVGVQESHGEKCDGKSHNGARTIADLLGWHYFDQGDEDTAILSRYPIVANTTKRYGAALELPSGRRVWLFNVHFAHTPYQPYQLLCIPYNDAPFIKTAEEAVAAARMARGKQVAALLAEIDGVRGDGAPILITGDFNEPSALDWTDSVAQAKRCPISILWPTTTALLEAGFVDAYRQTHPDPLESPGYTWSPLTAESDPGDRHDRIDFVFVAHDAGIVKSVEVVGESPERADIVVSPYPSDHRAVVATIEFE
jgi:endonuclease/exonuclease/phosphatase family metal-dependent hydrolase